MATGRTMDSLPDAIHFLKSLAPFAGLPSAAVRAIASRCRRKSRQPGEALFREGDPCHDLYILAAGRVKCFRASPEGREQILKVFEHPGDIFCTTSAFSTGSHIVTAEAMNAVDLYVIDVETIKRMALKQPSVALALVTTAGDQLRSLVSLADDLSLKTATARVAKLLWERARAEGTRDVKGIRIRRAGLREDQIAANGRNGSSPRVEKPQGSCRHGSHHSGPRDHLHPRYEGPRRLLAGPRG